MPVSHEFKCIFVHVPKCAGTSITKCLNMYGEKEKCLFGWDKENNIALQHLSIGEMLEKKYISDETYKNYFKFAFVRNPYDRALSSAAYHKISLIQFLKNDPKEFKNIFLHGIPFNWHLNQHLKTQEHYLYHNGNLKVDFVGRFENLKEDWNYIKKIIGCNRNLEKTNKSEHVSFVKYYNKEENDLVDNLYGKDFNLFCYNKKKLYLKLL